MRSACLVATGLVMLLPATALMGVAQAQPISGVYIGAGGGLGFLDVERVTPGLTSTSKVGSQAFRSGAAGLGSIGYALGNGVRLELEGSFRRNDLSRAGGVSGRETKYGAMGNVFFDMDIGSRYIYPYFGAGGGFQSVGLQARSTIAGTGTWSTDGSKGAMAYQAVLGAAFPIPGAIGLSVTAEYRYLGLAGTRSAVGSLINGAVRSTVSRKVTQDDNHDVLIGLRYAFNVTPPSAPAPVLAATPAPVLAPSPAPSRTYLVFFDWDRSDLTDRARQVLAEAARASTRVAATRIEVAGHADKSGMPAYNQALSLARAQSVSAELVRLGVPAASIAVSAFGDTKPLVPTAAGVREPQNRRVEIVLK